MTSKTKHGERVRLKIIEAGMQLWANGGHFNVTARKIGESIGMTHTNILYHFKDTARLREAIAKHAVDEKNSKVIVHLIALNHSLVKGMNDAERFRHMSVARK